MRPTRLLAYAALLGAASALVLAGCAAGGLVGLPLARAAALFLACFGLGKLLLGLDAVAALRGVAAGGPDPRLGHSRPAVFWLWVAYKLGAGAAAIAAAALLWGRSGAFIPR